MRRDDPNRLRDRFGRYDDMTRPTDDPTADTHDAIEALRHAVKGLGDYLTVLRRDRDQLRATVAELEAGIAKMGQLKIDIIPWVENPNARRGKLANAEIHLGGLLTGVKLTGVSIWARPMGGRRVSYPTERHGTTDRRAFHMMRPVGNAPSQARLRTLVLQAFAEYERGLRARDEAAALTPAIEPRPPRSGPWVEGKSTFARAVAVLYAHGHPLHIDEIVARMQERFGETVLKTTLAGELSTAVNTQRLCYRDSPGVYGLLEWQTSDEAGPQVIEEAP